MDMSVNKLQKTVKDREAMGSQRVRHDWVTELNWIAREDAEQQELSFTADENAKKLQ